MLNGEFSQRGGSELPPGPPTSHRHAQLALTSRLIDRPIRPLINKQWTFETQVMATVVSSDQEHDADVLALIGRGPLGAGMEETYQLTAALKYLDFGKHVAVLTDARFSGVSTGACIGHISPEALAGGPLGRLQDGDLVEIVIDPQRLEGSVNLVGAGEAARLLASRPPHPALAPDPALQSVSGGVWGGCVFDTDAILRALGTPRTT